MPIVLTVDDSGSVRSMVGKALRELGFDIEQAEDGEKGLALLARTKVDLILLDVTMPVMDGPTMLKVLRGRGDKTPVIMLTSESKRAVVAGAMQLGIDDYMLKPFKPDELRAKVFKALRMYEDTSAASPAVGPAAAAAPRPAAAKPSTAVKTSTDILIVDDMDNVHKKLRSILPPHLTMHGAVSAHDAMTQCQETWFRLVLIDMVMPDVNSVAVMNQLRAVQPQAVFVALVLRSAHDPRAELTAAGFSDYLFKPFDPGATAELFGKVFERACLLDLDSNLLTAAAFEGKEDKVERYYTRLRAAAKDAIEQVAAACYDEVILDLRLAPLRTERTIRMVIDLDKDARKLGVQLRLVGTAEAGLLLQRVIDTAHVPLFASVEHARAMAA